MFPNAVLSEQCVLNLKIRLKCAVLCGSSGTTQCFSADRFVCEQHGNALLFIRVQPFTHSSQSSSRMLLHSVWPGICADDVQSESPHLWDVSRFYTVTGTIIIYEKEQNSLGR